MQAALESVDGVEVLDVDYTNKTATVSCSKDVDPAELAAALEESGYGCDAKSN